MWTLDIDIRSRHDGSAERATEVQKKALSGGVLARQSNPHDDDDEPRHQQLVRPLFLIVLGNDTKSLHHLGVHVLTIFYDRTPLGDCAHDELRERMLQKTCFTGHWHCALK